MAENVFEELKRYVGFSLGDEEALKRFHASARPHFVRIADVFYKRILEHPDARKALEGGEGQVGRLKITLVAWMERLMSGPWDEDYFQLRCRIGRVHVRINLPQHYMFGAMNVVRLQMHDVLDAQEEFSRDERRAIRAALVKILDLELAVMLHTYREDLVAQQAKNERLSTFGQLVGSIGHELRNPLGVIETSLYILQGRVNGDERAEKHVGRIAEQVGIANDIITSLLDMIRDRPLQREKLQLGKVVEAAVSAVPHPDAVNVQVQGLDGVSVEGDAGQLRQVFVNLLINAVHAASPKGDVRVRAESFNGKVHVAVEDSGPGVDESIRRRLFEPLVTTKAKGIGLGLALVKRIIERHGGTIAYEPPPSGGARFVIHLPRSA
jgi:signal transduction histidine kinase